jgi:hypothetical protein
MPIDFSCSACGKKYRVKDELAGKTAKCTQCNGRIQIPDAATQASAAVKPSFAKAPAPQPARSAAPSAASRPAKAAKPKDELSSWFDAELPTTAAAAPAPAAKLGVAAKAATAGPKKSTLCPSCRVPLATGAVICVACGYDVRKGEKLATKKGADADDDAPVKKAASAASFGRGALFSAIGAAIGAAIWAGVAIATQYEIGWIAWGLGALAGAGMALGHEDKDGTAAGVTAAGISLAGILVAKVAIYQYFTGMIEDSGVPLAMLEQLSGESLGFGSMFSPMDGLFFLLAVGTAYKLGSGQATD